MDWEGDGFATVVYWELGEDGTKQILPWSRFRSFALHHFTAFVAAGLSPPPEPEQGRYLNCGWKRMRSDTVLLHVLPRDTDRPFPGESLSHRCCIELPAIDRKS